MTDYEPVALLKLIAGTTREKLLNDILTILGTTKTLFVPGWEEQGSVISAIGVAGFTVSDEAGAVTLQAEYAPAQMPCGLNHYGFVTSLNHNWNGVDDGAFSFGDGAADTPFSVGLWVRPNNITVAMDFLAKYDPGATEEWRFGMTSAGKPFLELYDASANASEVATTDAAITAGQWVFLVATYDGVAATPGCQIYVNGVAGIATADSVESGSYVAMENITAPLMIGASDVTASPDNVVSGRLAMPFICGKALTAAEVLALYAIMVPMVGADD